MTADGGIAMKLDTDKLDDAALAILSLTLHDGRRVTSRRGTGPGITSMIL